MGRLEKIVVCTVLFLVFTILGISLSTDPDGDAQAGGSKTPPAASGVATERRLARERAQRERAEMNGEQLAGAAPAAGVDGAAPAGAPGGIMSTSLAPRAGDATQAPAQTPVSNAQPAPSADAATPTGAAPAGNAPANAATPPAPAATQPPAEFLVSRAGLTPTASDEFMTYTWQAGDSFRALAQRFYGSPLHVKRLRDANEGRDEAKLAAGDTILVTVKPTAQADRLARPGARDAKSTENAGAAVVGGTYTVGSGDVLGEISKKVYGTATKWRTIYDANRDVIGTDPNRLKPGMVLRIPQ